MNSFRTKLCKESFQHFLYEIRSRKNESFVLSGTKISANYLLSDSSIENMLHIYNELFENEQSLILVKNHERTMGFTVFCCLYLYYKCSYGPHSNMFFVTKNSNIPITIINEIGLILRPITTSVVNVNKGTKNIVFEKNNSSIRFLTDTAYEFRAFKDSIDLVIFDNAKLSNYEKLAFFTETVLNNDVAKKVLMNFNYNRDNEEIERLEKELVGKINVITELKNKTII